jgi:hypothetical protein
MTGVIKASAARFQIWAKHHPTIVFPVIVVGGSLVELGYEDNGDRVLRSIPHQRILWNGSTSREGSVLLDVVQRDYLPTWVEWTRQATQEIVTLYD